MAIEFRNYVALQEEIEFARFILEASGRPPMIVQQGNTLVSPKGNVLVPYGKWDMSAPEAGKGAGAKVGDFVHDSATSGFLRDQPALSNFSLANAENLAATIIFVLLTIRADFMQVMQDFPTVLARLHTVFGDRTPKNPLTPDEWGNDIDKLQSAIAGMAHPRALGADSMAAGYSVKTTAFGFKNDSIPVVWTRRNKIFRDVKGIIDRGGKGMSGETDTPEVRLFRYLKDNIHGLSGPKAGFVTQILMGKLGCIDMHNINLYYAKYKAMGGERGAMMTRLLHPKNIGRGSEEGAKDYITAINELAKDGYGTAKLWDIWTNFIGHNYTVGDKPRYDITGRFAGKSVDPSDPAIASLADLGHIPDENSRDKFEKEGRAVPNFHWGVSPSANTGSRAHRIISQIRTYDFWMDQLAAAETGVTPDEIRVNANKDQNFKALASLVADDKIASAEGRPSTAEHMGLPSDFVSRAHKALQRRGLFAGADYAEKKTGQMHLVQDEPLSDAARRRRRDDAIRRKAERATQKPQATAAPAHQFSLF